MRKGRRGEPRRDVEISGGVCGLDGSAVIGSSPQPSGLPGRQAGFTAARPAAKWIPASAWKTPSHNLEISGQSCVARRADVELRLDADCALEDGNGCLRPYVVRRIGRAKSGSDPEEDHAPQTPHWP